MRITPFTSILAMLLGLASFSSSYSQTTTTTSVPVSKTPGEAHSRATTVEALETNVSTTPAIRTAAATPATEPIAAAVGQEIAAARGGEEDDPGSQVIPAPILLSYREVKDNFGKRIADTYVVVQVNIKNSDIEHQFLLQDLRVVFDPNQCAKAGEFFGRFDVPDCEQKYNKYLRYPIAYAPVAQPALQAVATIGQFQNPRNFAFRFLDFAANMGGALTGFNFIGRDGKAGLSVFNGTFLTASKTFVPDLTAGHISRLSEQSYKPNTLVESKDTKTYDVFIPSNQVFTKDTWKLYKQTVGNASAEAVEMLRLLQLCLTATASGTHVQNVGPPIEKTGGGAPDER